LGDKDHEDRHYTPFAFKAGVQTPWLTAVPLLLPAFSIGPKLRILLLREIEA